MSAPLRDIKLIRSGNQQRAPNLIGLDESTTTVAGTRYTLVVGVRSAREDETSLLRALIENDLQPFRHKSSTLLQYSDVASAERYSRVSGLIDDLADLPITWSAVLWEGPDKSAELAASAVMAAKKSITNGLQTGEVQHGCDPTAFLHDGREDAHSEYFTSLQKQVPSAFDTGFQRSICPVFLTFLEDADRIYPATNTADYIAGYLADKLHDGEFTMPSPVEEFDNSWVDPAPQPEQPYQLDPIRPVRGEGLRSRVLAWIFGKGIPRSPSPTTQDPYRDLVTQIDDSVVTNYLLEEL